MKPAFAYPGGKTRLLDKIRPFFPRGIKTYCEPFAGSLAVALSHYIPFPREVYNDASRGLVAFYRHASRHPDALIETLRGMIHTRDEFAAQIKTFPRTELELAAQWYYLIRASFGAKGLHFGRDPRGYHGVVHSRDADHIRALSARLKNAEFLCGDFSAAIKAADSPDTLFFCDPPYIECANTAYDAFSRRDMERVRDTLSACEGRWILTCDNSSVCQDIFKDFSKVSENIKYTLSRSCKGKVSSELIVLSPRLAKESVCGNMLLFPGAKEKVANVFAFPTLPKISQRTM